VCVYIDNVEKVTQFNASEIKGTMFIYFGKVDWGHNDPKDKMRVKFILFVLFAGSWHNLICDWIRMENYSGFLEDEDMQTGWEKSTSRKGGGKKRK